MASRATEGSLFTGDERARIKRIGEPIALALGRLGFTPDALTVAGLAGTIHQLAETIKQVRGIMRASSSLRVILDRECWNVEALQTFHHIVIEADVANDCSTKGRL